MAKKWTQEQLDFLKENYNKMSKEKLCSSLNKTWSAILHQTQKMHIFSTTTGAWSLEEIQFLKDNYKTMTYKQLAEKLGRTKTAIDLKINKLGLIKSKYIYDHAFFKNITTEEQAYWCGFIMADGCVSINEKTNSCELCIKLQAKDAEHLQKFNLALHGNIPVKVFEEYSILPGAATPVISQQCQIRLYSEEMVHDLDKYGVVPNKSLIKKFPHNIPADLMRHYIRGYFDGNGSLTFTQKSRRCTFYTGSYDFAIALHDYINQNVCKTSSVYKNPETNCYIFYCSSYSSMYLLLNFLYKESNIKLNRKSCLAQQFLQSEDLNTYLLRHPEIDG